MVSESIPEEKLDLKNQALETQEVDLAFLHPFVNKLREIGMHLSLFWKFIGAHNREEEIQICREFKTRTSREAYQRKD